MASCIEISDMRWNYTIFLSEGRIYEFKCVVVKVLPDKIHLLLDLDTLKCNKNIRKPTLNAVKTGTKLDASVLKLLTNIITAKRKACGIKNEMRFSDGKTKCAIKKHPSNETWMLFC